MNLMNSIFRKNNKIILTSKKFYSTPAVSAPRRSRVSLVTDIRDSPGSLHTFLRSFYKYDINLTHIESKPTPKECSNFHMYIDFDGNISDAKTQLLLKELKESNVCKNIMVLDDKTVPWFPRDKADLDFVANRTLSAGAELEADHPGFNDPVYRKRRLELGAIAQCYKAGCVIPVISYTESEKATWSAVYGAVKGLHQKYACKEYLDIIPLMEKHCGFSCNNIPQVKDISAFLKDRTGFTLRPVAGLLSSRDFLNGLAFRIFFSTQYIRHSSRPLYTPEPDICHELLGHAPMFADPEFADLSQEIGLASLGATDEDIAKLATVYWFTVEFGLIRDPKTKETKAIGAGVLSSCGELEYAATAERRRILTKNENKSLERGSLYHEYWSMQDAEIAIPEIVPFDTAIASITKYPITHYQPKYFVADSLSDMKINIRKYFESIPKPFYVRYNDLTGHVWVDRAVKREPHNVTNAY